MTVTVSGPKSSKFKVAFTGTNSSGKTTMAMDVASRLKYQHVLAELVSSQDRKITWKDEHFPIDIRAHYGMISNLVNAEVQAELKGDARIVVTDRSVLDLYAIARYDHKADQRILGMEGYIKSWLSTYTRIYYLEPLPYQEDGKRPPDAFRMATHGELMNLMASWELPNLVKIKRSEIYSDITKLIGIHEPKPIFAEQEKWQAVVNLSGCTLAVKSQGSPSSDVDVWVFTDGDLSMDPEAVAKWYFGDQLEFHFMAIPTKALKRLDDQPFIFNLYEPEHTV